MPRSEIEQLIREVYEARKANDVDRCAAYFGEPASLRFPGSPDSSPIVVTSSTRDAVRKHIADLVRDWHWKSFEIVSMIIEGNRAAVHLRVTTTFTPTNETLTTEVVDLVTVSIEQRKLTNFIEFVDTAKIAGLVARSGRAT